MTLPLPRPRTAALLLAVLTIGCQRAAPSGEEKAPPATVKWEGASTNALEEWTELVGTTTPLPDKVARVTAPVEARVASLLTGPDRKPVEGQVVDENAVLVRLDATVLEANLAKLRAGLDALTEEHRQAQLAVELANAEVKRLARLKESESSAPRPGISLVSAVEQEKADIALRDAQSKLKGADAKLVAGRLEIDALEKQIALYTVTTPIKGRVGRLQVVPGQTVSVGAPVAEVIDLEQWIDVLCYVPPSVAHHLQVGQQATSGPIEKDPAASSEAEAAGRVEYVADQAEPETGNFAVKVRFENGQAHLRANRVLRIRVLTGPGKECLSLPEKAVMEDEEPPTVVIVEDVKTAKNAEGKEETTGVARRLQVELGRRDRILHQVEILRLIDPEKDPEKKWHGDLQSAQFVVESGSGVQTGDAVKLEADED
jgi:multidrug efflux pump subunit AcrA (membrane-fusion protein)